MIEIPATGMALLVGAWLLLAAVLVGIGHLSSSTLGLGAPSLPGFFDRLWLGLAALTAGLLLWHLFLPVDWRSTLLFGGLGLLGAARAVLAGRPAPPGEGRRRLLPLLLALPPCLLVANVSLGAPDLFDAGMYHIQGIRWANEYGVVRGLANLNIQHGFHSSSFLLSAWLNIHPVGANGWRVLNSFLWVALFLEGVLALPALARPGGRLEDDRLLAALYVPILAGMAGRWGLHNPTPDMAATLVALKAFQQFTRVHGDGRDGSPRPAASAVLTTALSATLVTVKLSGAVFGLSMCLIVWAGTLASRTASRRGGHRRLSFLSALFPVLILAPWLAWGAVSSGYPLFPSVRPSLAVPWRVPEREVAATRDYILHWNRARTAREGAGATASRLLQRRLGGTYAELMTGRPGAAREWVDALRAAREWDWLLPWTRGLLRWPTFAGLMGLAFLGLVLHPVASLLGWKAAWERRWLVALLPLAVSFPLWLTVAPSPRFGLFLAACLAAWAWMTLLLRLAHSPARPALPLLLCTAMIPFVAAQLYFVPPRLVSITHRPGFPPLPEKRMVARRTDSGLEVFVPEKGMKSWNFSLPSTPYFNPGLRLLDEERGLAGGFAAGQKEFPRAAE